MLKFKKTEPIGTNQTLHKVCIFNLSTGRLAINYQAWASIQIQISSTPNNSNPKAAIFKRKANCYRQVTIRMICYT